MKQLFTMWLEGYNAMHKTGNFTAFVHLLSFVLLGVLTLFQLIFWYTEPTMLRGTFLALAFVVSLPYIHRSLND